MKRIPDHVARTIRFEFDNRPDGTPIAPITFDATKASPLMSAHAEMHGWMAKIGDAAALSRKQKDGSVKTVTEAERAAEVARMVGRFEGGATEWNERGGPAARIPAIEALARALGKTYEACLTDLANEAAAKLA